MASKRKGKSRDEILNDLVPNSVMVKMADGKDVRVAMDKEENTILNMMMVSQLRSIIQSAMQSYADKDVIPSPKELRDLAGAIKDSNDASNAVYEKLELPNQRREEKAIDTAMDGEVDFGKLSDTPKVETNDAGPSKVDPQPDSGG